MGEKVLLFSKVRDQYCMEVERVLKSLGVFFSVVDVDTLPDGNLVLDRLDTLGGLATAPHLFVDGKSIGGCYTIKRYEKSRELHVILARHIDKEKAKLYEEDRIASLRFLYFPESVDNRALRFSALFVLVYSVVCVAMNYYLNTKWAVLALAIDFALRYIGGPDVSIAGTLGIIAVSDFKPDLVPGRIKQFSSSIGLLLAVIAAILFFTANGNLDIVRGGIAMLLILAVFSFFEVAFNFDIGSWLYSFAFKLRWTRDDVFRPHIHLQLDKSWESDFSADAAAYKAFHTNPANRSVSLPGQKHSSSIDLTRKVRLETEFKMQDFDILRHTKVDFFAAPMAIAALAYCFKITDTSYGDPNYLTNLHWGTKTVADSLSIISVIPFGALTILYAFRTILYPKKTIKDFNHPIKGVYFMSYAICLMLYGLLMYDFYIDMGIVLAWIGAIVHMILSVNMVSNLAYNYHSDDIISPAFMMMPIGNFIAALALATYGTDLGSDDANVSGINYVLLSRFWFGVACLFSLTLFICTFKTSFTQSYSDIRDRPLIWLWMGSSAIAGPAYIAANNVGLTAGFDVFYHTLWLISVCFFAMNMYGIARGFFTFVKDMSIWNMAFASSLLSINTVQYYSMTLDTFTRTLVMFSITISCFLTGMSGLITILAIKDKSLFKARLKWAPATFLNLTHEAFRYSILGILKLLYEMKADNLMVATLLIDELKVFFKAYREHSAHEEHVFFPAISMLFPGLEKTASHQHRQSEKLMDFLLSQLVIIKNGANESTPSPKVVESMNAIRTHLPTWCYEALEHMRLEESTVSVIIRKYMSIDRQRDCIRRSFEVSSIDKWSIVLPYLLKNLPMHVWKVRMIRSLVWVILWN